MGSWTRFEDEAPELAARIRERFEAHGLALLATLRRDGSPRLTGIETFFGGGELWLGMMAESRKGADLRRDPRLALHAATIDKDVRAGDAKLNGRGILAGPDEVRTFVETVSRAMGGPPPEPFDAFRVDVVEASILTPGGDHLVIEWWREGDGVHRVERR